MTRDGGLGDRPRGRNPVAAGSSASPRGSSCVPASPAPETRIADNRLLGRPHRVPWEGPVTLELRDEMTARRISSSGAPIKVCAAWGDVRPGVTVLTHLRSRAQVAFPGTWGHVFRESPAVSPGCPGTVGPVTWCPSLRRGAGSRLGAAAACSWARPGRRGPSSLRFPLGSCRPGLKGGGRAGPGTAPACSPTALLPAAGAGHSELVV